MSQESMLKSLPTSLYTAHSKFDIVSKTTLYAACPSCNHTHSPCYDPINKVWNCIGMDLHFLTQNLLI